MKSISSVVAGDGYLDPIVGQFCKWTQNIEREMDDAKKAYAKEQIALGEKARQARENAGLSLREVARRMKVSAPYLSDLELGRRHWSKKQAEKWKEAMK